MTKHITTSVNSSTEECSNSEPEGNILLSFRPLQDGDDNQIKALHEELFPVKYSEDFYKNVVKNKSLGGTPLYSRIAVWNRKDVLEMAIQNNLMENLASNVDVSLDELLDLDLEDRVIVSDKECLDSLQDMECGGADQIISCIIGGFVKCSEIKDGKIANTLIRNRHIHPRMFYIMTLGNTERFRKQRLGTKMINDCLKMIEKVPTCGVVYLHVITYNNAAIKFYEKLGFYRIEEIKDYYNIEGVKYDCYLYAYFVNGNHPTFYHLMTKAYRKVLKFFSS